MEFSPIFNFSSSAHVCFLPDISLIFSTQPVPPCVSLTESVLVYKEHCKMAREYHKVECEIAALEERK